MLLPGVRLGRYEVLSPLGAGGMGEVYRARDTELDRKVALKVLPDDVATDPDRLKRFEREAKATAALSHPNVLTVFDVGREDGRAYLVFELLEGSTLGTRLARGRLPPPEALAYAVQMARGLAAAHARGIVHRDLKPDNLFLTTSGVLKILDFGLARVRPMGERNTTASDVTGPGTVMGTVSYMSPEQAKGHPGDARSDIFALGTVLYEMLSGRHPFKRDSSAETLTAILRDEPKDLGTLADEVPKAVERLVRRCLEKKAEDRFQTANDLALALEAVGEAQDREDRPAAEERPYPGLASFTEADAPRFFGREAEIAALWEKIRRQKLLALIGPSGAGKTSFLRAGVFAQRPTGWGAVYVKPGASPISALVRALTPQLTSDPEAMADLVQGATDPDPAAGDERLVATVSRWRKGLGEALLVVDPFEELFTLNPKETQDRFAGLLGRLAGEADVHVLLSLRDDFLFRCTEQPALGALLQDLTPLRPPSPEALHRALVEPAARLGVRFEEEALVGEMVATVGSERGALPLLAFAASRLWEMRDRDRSLLTRQAYQEIGGVAGALAQHAEATLQEIGPARASVVREIFRNLITSQGTRVGRERGELLSVFAGEDRAAAEVVLDSLVDARLLTEFERPGEQGQGSHQEIEVIHESLLVHWPQLVRWQTQDADGAQLRDQLRQTAQVWQDRSRPEDLLWSGTAYLDYRAWRTRYPVGLSSVEEEFAQAMTARANRQRRRRRAVVSVTLALLTGGLAIMGGLWRRATLEAQNREAAQLLSLGRLRLDDHPSAALAYAIASLERADSEAARRFAVEALWQGPTEFIFGTEGAGPGVRFSPDGQWMAYGSPHGARLYSSEGGASRGVGPDQTFPVVEFSLDSRRLFVRVQGAGPLRLFSLPGAQEVGSLPLGERWPHVLRGDHVFTFEGQGPPAAPGDLGKRTVLSWPLSGGEPLALGTWDARGMTDFAAVGPDGSWLAEARNGTLALRRLDALGRTTTAPVGRDEKTVWENRRQPGLATVDMQGKEIRLWSVSRDEPRKGRILRGSSSETIETVTLDPNGRFVSGDAKGERVRHRLWDLLAPPDVDPLALRDRNGEGWIMGRDFDPTGRWLAAVHDKYGALWVLHDKRPRVLRGIRPPYLTAVAFSPDGRHLASGSFGGELWLWPLEATGGERMRLLYEENRWLGIFAPQFDPRGRFVIVCDQQRGLFRVPLHGGPPTALQVPKAFLGPNALRRDGRLLAAAATSPDDREASRIHIWDMEGSGDERTLDPNVRGESCAPGKPEQGLVLALTFLPDGRLLGEGLTGLRVFDLASGANERLRPCRPRVNVSNDMTSLSVTPNGRTALIAYGTFDTGRTSELLAFDLETRAERTIVSHGNHIATATLDPSGTYVVTGSGDGLVRVGPLSGDEPHLLYGHTALVTSVSVSPDGKWIASAGEDGTIRLWPMPNFAQPPLHTLPPDALLAKLRTLTNLRVVADPGSATGYKIEPGPFPGWAKVPEW